MINPDNAIKLDSEFKVMVDKPHLINCFRVASALAEELFKSKLNEKIKINAIDLNLGKDKEGGQTKFSIKIEGILSKEEKDEFDHLRTRFIERLAEIINDKTKAKELIEYFSEVKISDDCLKEGEKFKTISGSFNMYGNKNIIEHEEGRVMLIDIWATWCKFCVSPMEDNVSIFKDLKDSHPNIDILAIACDENNKHKEWVDFVKAKKWNQIQNYRNRDIMTTLGISSIPHIIIVDTHGKIYYSGHPAKITNLKAKLISLTKLSDDIPLNTIVIDDKIDPNPQWMTNGESEREEIINTINEILLGEGINNVKFVVSSKYTFFKKNTNVYTQPIISGYINEENFEALQGIGIMICDDFGLKELQYNVKLLSMDNNDYTTFEKLLKK